MPVHINLGVASLERSLAFYQRWLDFGAIDRRFDDGTVFLRDGDGTDLALVEHDDLVPPARTMHIGFRRAGSDEVRSLHAALAAAAVEIVEWGDDDTVTSVKFLDPDGYLVEVYAET